MNRREILKAIAITPLILHPKLFGLTSKNIKLQKKCVIGIGDGSCNIIDDIMLTKRNEKIEFVQMNRDLKFLKTNKAKNKIYLEKHNRKRCFYPIMCHKPGMMCQFSKDARDKIKALAKKDYEFYFILTFDNQTTNYDNLSIIRHFYHMHNKKINLIAIKPFDFEGQKGKELANETLAKMPKYCKSIQVLDNNMLLDDKYKGLKTKELFQVMSDYVYGIIV